MIELPSKINRASLLALPHRKWDEVKAYDFLYLVPTGKKHDSGYMLIAVVGVSYDDKKQIAEIAATCDDVCWSFPTKHPYDRNQLHSHMIRTDCLYPSGIMRMWASGEHYFSGKFEVQHNVSSTEIILKVVSRGDGVNKATGEVIK